MKNTTNLRCPSCFNHEVEKVEGHEDLYICNECAAELKGLLQYDGSIKLVDYFMDEGYNNLDDYNILECEEKSMKESAHTTLNYDAEKKTDWALFVYNDEGNVVNMSGFADVRTALEFAEDNNYPVIKVHRYYVENDKHYPDGDPVVIWKEGKAYNSFIEDEDGPVPDGGTVTLKESIDYPTYGTFRAEFVVRAESSELVKEAVQESFEGTAVIGHLCSDVVISADDDNYKLTFDFEMLDKYAKKTEMFEIILDTLADYNVSVISYDFDQIK